VDFMWLRAAGAQRTKLTGGPLRGRSPACGTSALSDGLGGADFDIGLMAYTQ
jgi:hypothetical protein